MIHASKLSKIIKRRTKTRNTKHHHDTKKYKILKKLIAENKFQITNNIKIKKNDKIFKYWRNRNTLFSKINTNKIYMTEELWFSVTPELIAKFISNYIKACLSSFSPNEMGNKYNGLTILDVFCGGGGNTIQFAMDFPRVYGIDSSIEHIYCTIKNSQAYNVDDRIYLKCGKLEKIIKRDTFAKEKIHVDCVFASPPWGGPEYLKEDTYDLEKSLKPFGLYKLLKKFFQISKNVILFLPRNSNLYQLSNTTRKLLGPGGRCKVLYVKINGYMKGMFCIWGDQLINYGEQVSGDVVELNTNDQNKNEANNDASNEKEEEVNSKSIDEVYYDIDG
ncbi:RNA methyltransferase NDAI_0K01340 [Naumovozyma dairenensis CBS 421]|uniref:Trimethylguanosine synthase n=1 Tax=Naumovozyma dairenensis (strain ATCC 10597 / BCRC 20456 / CBS 421 / NBRC 0211 / NRRL Y-12639) TaxID=1071378 RepID=G0WHR4_NAUDC|nr:hypothetical protein NDAI_0K01340 [Naumovozyma dairenensis CBS 421]CCD27325.1 hypothetical protein NDAI_0K01340 [Naumovozyma dairenensis CBS 421]